MPAPERPRRERPASGAERARPHARPLTPDELAQIPKQLLRELERTAKRRDDAARALLKCMKAREMGRLIDAQRAAERAKDAAPRSPSAREALGTVLFELGRWSEAVAELSAYRRLGGDARHDVTIAEADHRAGKTDRALDRLEEIIASHPNARIDRAAQLLRARLYAETGRADQARGLLESMRRKTSRG